MSESTTFFPATSTPTRADAKLPTFASLPRGWHYGEGDAIQEHIIESAKRLVTTLKLQGFRKLDAFPGPDGGVGLAAMHSGHLIELFIEPNGSYSLSHEQGDVEFEAIEHATWIGMREALRRVVRRVWPLFDGYTQSFGTLRPDASTRTSTKTWATECRSSTRNVRNAVPG